jgi:hypothetical protein
MASELGDRALDLVECARKERCGTTRNLECMSSHCDAELGSYITFAHKNHEKIVAALQQRIREHKANKTMDKEMRGVLVRHNKSLVKELQQLHRLTNAVYRHILQRPGKQPAGRV